MKIENLKEGQIIKNYKKLCTLLDIKISAGNTKKAQLKELERFINYSKEGNKFIIKEIYKEVKEKEDNRGQLGLYKEDIERLIIDLLVQSKNKSVFLSIGLFLKKLNLINDNYMYGKRYILKLSELTEVNKITCNDFYDSTHDKLKDMLERALNSLRKKALISWYKVMTVCIYEPAGGNNSYNYVLNYRKATELERAIILECEKKVLNDFSLNSLQEVVYRGIWSKYINEVNKIVKEKTNIEFYYDSYDVVYNYKDIKEERDKLEKKYKLNKQEIQVIKEELNSKVVDGLLKSAIDKNNSSKVKMQEWEDYCKEVEKNGSILTQNDYIYIAPKGKYINRFKDNYVDDNNKLINTVIKSNAKDIRNKLRNPVKQDKRKIIGLPKK